MVKYNGAAMTSIFHALADPTRRALVEALGTKERTVGELADPLSISLPAVSKHIGVLERAGLLKRRREGRSYHLRVDHEGLQPAIDWIEQQRQIWEGSFDKLSSYLEIHN
jgi:DNA-binding transcriptional ArsR family regulator